MQDIAPVSGWALNFVVELDRHVAGVCRAFLCASAERRQVISALLSVRAHPFDEDCAAKLGNLAMRADHTSILKEAFGDVPTGMRGALSRSGPQPHSRHYYRKLYDLFAARGRVAQVLQRLRTLDFERLRIAEVLPSEICTENVVSRIRSVRMASDVRALFGLLTEHGVDPRSLADSLARVGEASDFPEVWERWAMKCSFPPHPVPASNVYVPITSGTALRRMALKYRNCARRYLSMVLDQQSAFAEFHHDRQSVVVHLCQYRGQWVLDNLFGPDNRGVAAALRDEALAYLARYGVTERYGDNEVRGPWRVLRRLTRSSFLLDVDFD